MHLAKDIGFQSHEALWRKIPKITQNRHTAFISCQNSCLQLRRTQLSHTNHKTQFFPKNMNLVFWICGYQIFEVVSSNSQQWHPPFWFKCVPGRNILWLLSHHIPKITVPASSANFWLKIAKLMLCDENLLSILSILFIQNLPLLSFKHVCF